MSEEPDVTLDGARMYRRMAEQALAQAEKTQDRNIRAQYVTAATQWLSLAEDMERFCESGR
jgi:hypothetical protein